MRVFIMQILAGETRLSWVKRLTGLSVNSVQRLNCSQVFSPLTKRVCSQNEKKGNVRPVGRNTECILSKKQIVIAVKKLYYSDFFKTKCLFTYLVCCCIIYTCHLRV